MDVMLLTWSGHRFARNALSGLIEWHERRGDTCRFSNFQVKDRRAHYGTPGLTYVWNGQYRAPWFKSVMEDVRRWSGVIKFVEIAWFPQAKFLYFDDMGTNGAASIRGDNFSWVTDEHRKAAIQHATSHYGQERWCGDERAPVLVPLQLPSDTQMRQFANGWTNQKLIDYACGRFEEVIVRSHPKDLGARYNLPSNASWQDWEKTAAVDALLGAGRVCGINSTMLLEATLLGVPVEHLGQSFLDAPAPPEDIIAGLVAKQVPFRHSDLDAWTVPHLGLAQPDDLPSSHTKPRRHLAGHAGVTHVDQGALEWLRDKCGCKTMLDLGCGPGGQVRIARELGLVANGIDGDSAVNPDILHDFSEGPYTPPESVDVVWSVEFVEHVMEEFVPNYTPVFEAAKIIVLTHALPGTHGHHHVNLQLPIYWVGVMAAIGFRYDHTLTRELREASSMERDFVRRNGLVFVR